MLELGKSGSHGTERGTVPVFSGDAVRLQAQLLLGRRSATAAAAV